jgi:nucleotide-binding universal stress UspA family protein
MLRLLLPIDGSQTSNQAVDYTLRMIDLHKDKPEIHLLNVQPALSGGVTMFIRRDQIKQFHHDEGLEALAAARSKLDAENVPYLYHISIGDPGEMIAKYAKEKRCDQICMGTRGLGHVAGMLLGSVTTKVIHLADMPILLVK